MDEHAAVDVDHCAGDVGGEVGGKEQVNVRHVLRVAEPIERNSLDDVGLHLGCELSTGNVRLDETWRHELGEFLAIPSVSADPAHREDVKRAGEWVCDFIRRIGGTADLKSSLFFNHIGRASVPCPSEALGRRGERGAGETLFLQANSAPLRRVYFLLQYRQSCALLLRNLQQRLRNCCLMNDHIHI